MTCFNAQSNGCRQYLAKRPRAHFFSMIIVQVLYNKYYTFAIKKQTLNHCIISQQSIRSTVKMEAKLNKFNYLNLAAFVISWALNSEVDMGPDQEFWSFLGGMRELGRRYESVVTPQETTFLIAHVALLFQGIFAVAQLLPKYRASSLVQVSHTYHYCSYTLYNYRSKHYTDFLLYLCGF